ncbi:urease accessory protein UreE [Salmonella enterica]
MIVIRNIFGNCKTDPSWQEKMQNAELDYLELDQRDAQKNSCRKLTKKGLDIGISLERDIMLKDGDIILYDSTRKYAVVVKITLREVMIIDLSSELIRQPDVLLKLSFELGHALGNQHWKAIIKNGHVFVPLTVAQKVMGSVIHTHGFDYLPYTFVSGECVLPLLSNSEARLLFGGAEDMDKHIHVDHHKHTHRNVKSGDSHECH